MSFETKSSFLSALAVFEAGSLICAVCNSSKVLIVGRAVQGLGSAGILTGAFVVGTHSVRLAKRPVLFAGVGILYGVGALCGPLLGGAFTDTIGWRWCFWINLPVGGVTLATVFLCFKSRSQNSNRQPFLKRLLSLDFIGNVILLGDATMLFLALQYSEQRYSWSSARIIGLMCGFGVTTIVFIVWMWYRGDAALLPPKIITQRTVASSCGAGFFFYGTLLLQAYYLPIWFQAIKGSSAIESGVNMIPYMAANAIFSLLAGIFVSKNGLFAPPAIVGCAIGTVGCGLLATIKPDTSTATWIGYEILVSGGIGIAIQQGFSAVQTALPLEHVPIGTAAVVAAQSCGGAIFVTVGNTLLQDHLLSADNADRIPGVNIRAVVELGTTQFRKYVDPEVLPALIELYNDSLQAAFIAAVPLCGLAFVCSLFMEWRSVKKGHVDGKGKEVEKVKKGKMERGSEQV
jgi:MFS family permease